MSEKILKGINDFSGLWGMIVVLIAIIIFFIRLDNSVSALDKEHVGVNNVHTEQIQLLRDLSGTLVLIMRDGDEFRRDIAQFKVTLSDASIVQQRTLIVLEQLSETLEHLNNNLYKK